MIKSVFYQKGKPLETNLTRPQMFSALHGHEKEHGHERETETLLWVDLENPNDFEDECLVEIFNFHDLAIEDCIDEESQPKADDYGEYLFLVVHEIDADEKEGLLTNEVDIFIGKNYVVTYHKKPLPAMEEVRNLLGKKPEPFMGHGSDMLVYHILDRFVEHYQPILDRYENKIDQLEEDIFKDPAKDFLSAIIQIKRDVFHLRKTIAPQRDTLNYLTRNPSGVIRSRHMIYFRDVYDHLFRIYGNVDGFYEALSGILQAYFSHNSNKLNITIQRMTVMATLSMPAIMIASIYGMNFKHMPELSHPYGYFFTLSFMASLTAGLLVWMKIKKWF